MKNLDSSTNSVSPFLDKPILINGVLSYYDKVINVDGDDYAIGSKPQESFYKNGKFVVNAIKINPSATYSDKTEESIFLYNGKSFKKIEGDYNFDHPIVTLKNGKNRKYMKYDKDLNIVNFNPKFPQEIDKGYYISYIDFGNGICELKNDGDDKIVKVLDINDNYNLIDLGGLPEGYYCSSIDTRYGKATITSNKNVLAEYKNIITYNYDNKINSISPIKGLPDNTTLDGYKDDGFVTIRDGELYQQLWFYDDGGIKKFEFELLEGSSDDIYNKKSFVSNDYQEKALGIIRVSLYKDKIKDDELTTKVFTRVGNTNKLKEVDISKVPNNDMNNGIKYVVTPNIFCIDEFNSRFYLYKDNKIIPLSLGDLQGKLKIYNDRGDRKSGYPLLRLEGKSFSDRQIVNVNEYGDVKNIQNMPKGFYAGGFKIHKEEGFDKIIVEMKGGDKVSSINGLLSGDCKKIVRYNDMIVSDISIGSKSITITNKYDQSIQHTFGSEERKEFILKNGLKIKKLKTKKDIKKQTKKDLEEVIK